MRQLKISQSYTNRDAHSLNKYLLEIGKVDLLSADQEFILTKKIQEGDKAALELLIKSNLRFVVSIAKQYQYSGLGLGDLINEGNLGLIKAAYRFDGTKGFKFISYSVWWIRQYILMGIAEHARIVRLPYSQLHSLDKVKKAFSKLEQDYEREPSYDEVAIFLETSVDKVSDSIKHLAKSLSLDSPFSQDEEATLLDLLPNNEPQADSQLVLESRRQEIMKYMKILPPKEEEVIRLFFGLDNSYPKSLYEIGRRLCLTDERVRQLKEKALKRLSKHVKHSYI
ncbi:MAG TPA: RNA polymerase subunit sigma [Sphingobacteriaceae bacterium]|nr:RNA polymerase subunit sigma [Sphingobacteriaceae bacterium]